MKPNHPLIKLIIQALEDTPDLRRISLESDGWIKVEYQAGRSTVMSEPVTYLSTAVDKHVTAMQTDNLSRIRVTRDQDGSYIVEIQRQIKGVRP